MICKVVQVEKKRKPKSDHEELISYHLVGSLINLDFCLEDGSFHCSKKPSSRFANAFSLKMEEKSFMKLKQFTLDNEGTVFLG